MPIERSPFDDGTPANDTLGVDGQHRWAARRAIGSGYENAPATILLATNCASCGRPLLDSVSVEVGMGPDCRAKYGISDCSGGEERSEANRLVHKIALRHGEAPTLTMMADVERLRVLGFDKLAKRLVERCCKVRIEREAGKLMVWTPFSDRANAMFRRIPGRRWVAERKANSLPETAMFQLWEVLKACFEGQLGYGPKGVFAI